MVTVYIAIKMQHKIRTLNYSLSGHIKYTDIYTFSKISKVDRISCCYLTKEQKTVLMTIKSPIHKVTIFVTPRLCHLLKTKSIWNIGKKCVYMGRIFLFLVLRSFANKFVVSIKTLQKPHFQIRKGWGEEMDLLRTTSCN